MGVLGADMVEMVGGDRRDLGGQSGATPGAELLGVDPCPHPVRGRRGEDPAGLVDGEGPFLDEDVAIVGETDHGGEHLLDDQLDVALPVPPVLDRDRVRPEEGGLDRDRQLLSETPRHLEQAHLGGGVEPVSGLDLDGGRPRSDHSPQAGGGEAEELVCPRSTGGVPRWR